LLFGNVCGWIGLIPVNHWRYLLIGEIMKVYLSKYRNHWISPYTILEKVFFWRKINYSEPKIERLHDIMYPFAERWMKLLDVIHPQITYVNIDKYDTWSADHTLALIILPLLKKIKEFKHGAPFVDDEDVPEELKSTSAPPKKNEWDTDDNFFKRWDYVLDEMIQAFECLINDKWTEQYSTGECDYQHVKDNHEVFGTVHRMVEGPNHTRKTDYVALAAHELRNKNGLRLFGKYFHALWD